MMKLNYLTKLIRDGEMSRAIQEEIIAALWTICFLISIAADLTIGIWVFGIKAFLDLITAIKYSIKEGMEDRLK